MSNDKDPFNEIEEGLKPALPQVTIETMDSIGGEYGENLNLISDTYWRMVTEQIPLTQAMAAYIEAVARDDEEAMHMKEVLALTYRALESQAQADAMSATFQSGPLSTELTE